MCRGKFRRSGAEIGHLPPLCAGKQRITRASKGRRRGRRRKRGWKSRDLSRSRPGGRVPLPPPEIRPLILVPHLPCAVSLEHRQMSLEAVRGDSSRNFGTILQIFFYFSKNVKFWKSFEELFSVEISFFLYLVGVFFSSFSCDRRNAKGGSNAKTRERSVI